jgi:phosphinothricin acetyltransferase
VKARPAVPRVHRGLVQIRSLVAADWPQVRAVYAAGIATGDATFETEPGEWAQWDATHLAAHRLVAVADGRADGADPERVLGWIAGSPTSARAVYAGVVEHSIYVEPAGQGRGVGGALLAAFIASTEAAGIWTLQTGIFPENAASLAVHRAAGFRVVGVRERLGRQGSRWRDVVLLERRSRVVG